MSDSRLCTYCLKLKPASSFTHQGDHVIMYSLGGEYVDPNVCDMCEHRSNVVSDQLIATDRLVTFLRTAYRIRDRYGSPPACEFGIQVPGGEGAIKVSVTDAAAIFTPHMSEAARQRLKLGAEPTQEQLEAVVAGELGVAVADPLALAQAARAASSRATPPDAWSRFMAKLGLAFGRYAYGADWLATPHAQTLSADLLGDGPPQLRQRAHHPPVQSVWPYRPPRHTAWIDMHNGVAVLMVVLFGQVLGAVPVANTKPPAGAYSAWSFDPVERTFHPSSYPAIWLGTAAARLTQEGSDVVSVAVGDRAVMFVPDGPDGPAEIPIPTVRAESPGEALQLLLDEHPDGPLTDQLTAAARRT